VSGGISNPYSGIFTITNTATASSTITGALQVVGGVGIGGDLYVGGIVDSTTAEFSLLSTPTTINFGFSASTQTANLFTGPTGDGNTKTINFGTGAGLGAITNINIGGPFGTTNVYGTSTNTPSKVTITNGTESISTDTGALIVTGGVGVGGNLNVGGIYTPSYQQVNATGTNQATAVGLSANVVKVLYGSSGGVRLPVVPDGTSIRIRSNISTGLNVYPPSGQEISTAGAPNLAYTQAPYTIKEYQFYNDLWFVIGLL
jgi:hypothetical protein